jgi:hypothetical protein
MSEKQVISAINAAMSASRQKTSPYDAVATVTRVEDGTAWVSLSPDSETPASMGIACKAGDSVNVRVSGGRAYVVGNTTAPPTDDAQAIAAKAAAIVAEGKAAIAKSDASEAKSAAQAASEAVESVRQHFYADGEGAHVAGGGRWQTDIRSDGFRICDGADEVFGIATENASGYNNGCFSVKIPSLADYKASGGSSSATYVAADIDVSGAKAGGQIGVSFIRDDAPDSEGSLTFTKGTASTQVAEADVLAFAYDGKGTVTVQATPGVFVWGAYERPDTWANVKTNGSINATRTVNADEGFYENGKPYCPFPVGSIYLTMQAMSSPSAIWPGTAWEQIECGRFLVAAAGRTDGDTTKDTSANEGNAGWYPIGEKGGERRHTLSVDEMPAHNHGSAGAHTHRAGYKRPDAYGSGKVDGQHWTNQNKGEVTTSSAGAHTHSTEGGGGSHENRPPYIAVAMWRRTA